MNELVTPPPAPPGVWPPNANVDAGVAPVEGAVAVVDPKEKDDAGTLGAVVGV